MSAEIIGNTAVRDAIEPYIGKLVDKELAVELAVIALGGQDRVDVLRDHLYPTPVRVHPAEIVGSTEIVEQMNMTRQAISLRKIHDLVFPPVVKKIQIGDLALFSHFATYDQLSAGFTLSGNVFTPRRAAALVNRSAARSEHILSLTPCKPVEENGIPLDDIVDITGIADALGV